MITLFHHPKSRSTRFIFLLEELEAPYQLRSVTIRRSDGSGAVDPANPHPHGKVPAISDDGVIVFESPAIALYLTDRFPKNHLGPLAGEPGRGAYLCHKKSCWQLAFKKHALERALKTTISPENLALLEQYAATLE